MQVIMTDEFKAPGAVAQQIWTHVQALQKGNEKSAVEIRSLHNKLLKQYGTYHINTLTAQIAVGLVDFESGNYPLATRNLIRVRQRLTVGYHEYHPLFVDLFGAMALVYNKQLLHLEAQALLEKALNISEQIYGAGTPTTAELHLRLGDCLRAQQFFDAAQLHYGNALSLYKELAKPDHILASIKLGELFHMQSRFEQSSALLEEVAVSSEFISLTPATIVHTLELLRESLHATNQVSKAALYELQRIQIVFETEPLTPIQKVNFYHRFLSLFELVEIPDVRENACRDFLELTKDACGSDSFAHAEAKQLLGECYCLGTKFDEARSALLDALQYFTEHPDTVTTQIGEILKTLGTMELYLQNSKQAEHYLNDALSEFTTKGITESIAYVQTLQALALLEKTRENTPEALRYLEQIISTTETNPSLSFFGEQARNELMKLKSPASKSTQEKDAMHEAAQNLNRVGALFNQALQLKNSKEYSRALRLFEEILTIMESAQGRTHPDLRPILEQLAFTHVQLGNQDMARSFEVRAQELGSN